MKILHIITSLSHGGAQEILFNIVINKQSTKLNHIVVSLRDLSIYGKLLQEKNIKCYHLNINQNKINLISRFIKLLKIIKLEKPDKIQSWMYHSDFLGSIASLLTKTPINWCLVNYSLDKSVIKLNTRIIAKVCSLLSYFVPKKIFSCSSNASNLHIRFGYKSNIFKNIDLGININKKKKIFQKNYDINNDFVIGCIGRWDPQKNHKKLIFAFNKIINEEKKNNFKLILAGPDIDYNNKDLVNIINTLNLDNKISLLGYVKNLDDFYSKIDLNILPSIGEAFPISLLESMVRKKIVIATNVGENLNILRDLDLIIKTPSTNHIYLSIIKIYKKYSDKLWIKKKEDDLQKIVFENYDVKNTIYLFEKEWLKNQKY